jgi:hypothetical protein
MPSGVYSSTTANTRGLIFGAASEAGKQDEMCGCVLSDSVRLWRVSGARSDLFGVPGSTGIHGRIRGCAEVGGGEDQGDRKSLVGALWIACPSLGMLRVPGDCDWSGAICAPGRDN